MLLCQFLWWTGAEGRSQYLGVIIDIDKNKNYLYTIATLHGILSNKYTQLTSLFALNSC